MRVRVVTDSSSSVPDEYLARLGIGEALASVNFGSESYLAKAELTLDEFYERLETADKLPTTSQPTPQQFAHAYERAAAEGADEIVAVCVSSALSGTLNSAVIAAEMASIPVHVWDTRHISMASTGESALHCRQWQGAEIAWGGRRRPEHQADLDHRRGAVGAHRSGAEPAPGD